MASIAKCPKCGQQVAIPGGMAFDAVVRCPLCKGEFPLHAMLISVAPAVPELIPVSGLQGAPVAPESLAPESLVQTQTAHPEKVPEPFVQPEVVSEPAVAATTEIVAEVVPEIAPFQAMSSSVPGYAVVVPQGAAPGPQSEAAVAPQVTQATTQQVAAPGVGSQPASEPTHIVPASGDEIYALQNDPAEVNQEFAAEGAGHDPWGPPTDGAAISGALMDLWKEAGVAPPIDAPETLARPAATAVASPAAEPTIDGLAFDFTDRPRTADGAPVVIGSAHTERMRQATKFDPKRTIRLVVGLALSGILGLLAAAALMHFVLSPMVESCRSRKVNPPSVSHPSSSPASTPSPAKTSPRKSTDPPTGWKGLPGVN